MRIKDMDKPLLCGKTAKDYKFWDNLMYHYKNLYPLYDKKVDFKQYTRCVIEQTLAFPMGISHTIVAFWCLKPEAKSADFKREPRIYLGTCDDDFMISVKC